MPNAALNAVTAPDNYTQASTLDSGSFLTTITLDVANQAIYYSAKVAPKVIGASPGLAQWDQEVFLTPGSRPIIRRGLCGVRFRAAIPLASLPPGAVQAVVTVEGVY